MLNPERFRQAALVLAAHGSHLNADSAAPCYAAADAIRGRELFAEVHECFWKQEPAFRHACDLVESKEVFVVPFFISDGYFTETVLPRELGVTPPRSTVRGKTVHYCQPVGTHEAMTRVILHRAETILLQGNPSLPRSEDIALFIAGHGTDRNENSAQSVLRQIELIRAATRYAEAHAIFLDQEPRVEACYEMAHARNLIVVPFFISDGFHTQEDLPAMLGLTRDAQGRYPIPSTVRGRRVWFTGAVGTDPAMVDVILARAAQAAMGASGTDSVGGDADPPMSSHFGGLGRDAVPGVRNLGEKTRCTGRLRIEPMHPAHQAFQRWLRGKAFAEIGQVWIRGGGRFELRHSLDREAASDKLETLEGPFAARAIATLAEDGRFRPLRSAPNLRCGWRIVDLDFGGLVTALDCFYPAAIVHWHAAESGKLEAASYRACAARQTGMYRITTKLTDQQVRRVAWCCCDDRECLKIPRWTVDEATDLDLAKPREAGPNRIPILCPEPCSLFLSLARKAVRLEQEEPMRVEFTQSDLALIGEVLRSVLDGTQTQYREGDYHDPRHRQRIQYFLKKYERLLPQAKIPSTETEE